MPAPDPATTPQVPPGMCLTKEGYLRIRRLPRRDRYAHREYADRCMQASLGRGLLPSEVVHHLCVNKLCWPPTDFHLLITDKALHDAIDAGRTPRRKARHRAGQRNFIHGEV